MAKNNIIFQGEITNITDSSEGQQIYSDLHTWQDGSADQEFNGWSTSPGSESANITLRIVDVVDSGISNRKDDIRNQLDQIHSDYGTSHNTNRFQTVEV